jgi:hypothetical protein
MVMTMLIVVFWVVMSYSLVGVTCVLEESIACILKFPQKHL